MKGRERERDRKCSSIHLHVVVVVGGVVWPRLIPGPSPPHSIAPSLAASLAHDSAVVCPQMANLVTLLCCVLLAAAVVAYAQRRSQLGE